MVSGIQIAKSMFRQTPRIAVPAVTRAPPIKLASMERAATLRAVSQATSIATTTQTASARRISFEMPTIAGNAATFATLRMGLRFARMGSAMLPATVVLPTATNLLQTVAKLTWLRVCRIAVLAVDFVLRQMQQALAPRVTAQSRDATRGLPIVMPS